MELANLYRSEPELQQPDQQPDQQSELQQPELQQPEPAADDDHQGPSTQEAARRGRGRERGHNLRERTVLQDNPPIGDWAGTGFTKGRVQCKYCDPKKTRTYRYTCSLS